MLPSLQLLQPTSVPEASAALSDLGERARVYAGGAELLLLLRHRLLEAEILIDIKKIAELSLCSADDKGIRIGSCMSHQALAGHPAVRAHAPSFAYAESQVANVRVRRQGTLGGNLCFNDPHSDPGTVLLVHDAWVKLANYKGERQLPLDQFFHDMYETALRPNEILTEVGIPPLPQGMNCAYVRLHRFQRPTLGIAVAATPADGSIGECRVAAGCAGPRPMRLHDLEGRLRGAAVGEARRIIDDHKDYLGAVLRPVDDLLGSAEYKLYMARVMIGQALEQAAQSGEKAND